MNRRALLRRSFPTFAIAAALTVAGFLACGPGGRSNPAGTGATTSVMITATSGGTVEVDGATLVIPPNALAADTTITITSSPTPAPSSFQALSPMYVFGPAGTSFAIPARLTIKRTLPVTRASRVYFTKLDSTTEYEGQPSSSSGETTASSITHFSNGFVGEAASAGSGGGSGGGGGGAPVGNFSITSLDPDAREALYVAADFDRVRQRVGVAYFTPRGTTTMMGRPDYNLNYVEYDMATGMITGPETIRYMQTLVGLDLKFDPRNGEPVVAYLGGAEFFIPGDSIYWFQSDAVMNRRSGGTWTETVVATDGNQIICGNPVSDRGFLVGLWPTLVFDSTGKLYFAYRDGHGGQYPQQDWAGSDVELWEGTTAPTMGTCVASAGNNKQAYGGHVTLVLGPNDQPAMIYDQMFGTADTNGNNVLFQQRASTGTWTPVASLLNIANTQTGATIDYDATEGFGVAVLDRATNELSYINSATGAAWNSVDLVYGLGSGGWYPSLAMDPMNHEPALAFYVCSPRSGVNEQGCTTTEDELRITQRIAGTWRDVVVDREGAYMPQLGFFGERRVVVYRHPPSVDPATGLTVTNVGELKIAVEN